MRHLRRVIAGLALLGMPVTTLAQEKVELNLWTIDDPGEYHYIMADEYMKLHPEVKINLRTVQFEDMVNDLAKAVATRSAPDITHIDNPEVALFASRGLLLDLKPLIDKSEVIKVEDIYPGPLASVSYEGGVYGIPRGASTLALYYNADMFRAAGLDPEKAPETWEQLYSAAKSLAKPQNNVYGLAFSAVATESGTFQFLPWVQMTGGDFNNLDTGGAQKALEFWKRLLDEKIASPDTLVRSQSDSMSTFIAGSAAMAISGNWEVPRLVKQAKFAYKVAFLPVPEAEGPRASALGEGDTVILKNSQHPQEAFAFLEYLYSQMPRSWNEFGLLPASKVEVKNPNEPKIYALFEESMKYARNRGPHPEWRKISQAIQKAVQTTLTGQADVTKALSDAQSTIDGLL